MNDDYKYIEIKQDISKKEKKYKFIAIILIIVIITFLFFIATQLLGFYFLTFIFSGGLSPFTNLYNIAMVLLFILIPFSLYLLSLGRKETSKDLIKVNINNKNSCINCGNSYDIERNKCPQCGYFTDYEYICPNCSTYNNLNRDQCINCEKEISIIDRQNYIKKDIRKYSIISIIMFISCFFIKLLIVFYLFAIFYCLIKIYDLYLILKILKKNNNRE